MSAMTAAHFRTCSSILVASLLLLGCDDDRTTRVTSPPDVVVGSVDLDPAIDAADSWATADITMAGTLDVASDEEYLDPATDATVTSSTQSVAPEGVHFQVGFSSGGQTVAVTRHTPDADDPDSSAVVVTKVVGTVATDYDAQGRVVPDTDTDTSEGPSPLSGLPELQGQPMIDALVKPPEDGGGGGGDECIECEMGLRAATDVSPRGLVRDGGERARVIARTARVLVLESTFDGSEPGIATQFATMAGGADVVPRRYRKGYSRQNEHWVLDSLTIEGEANVNGRALHRRTQLRFRNVRFGRNPSRDAARRKALREALLTQSPTQQLAPRVVLMRANVPPRSIVELESSTAASLTSTCTDRTGRVGSAGPSVVFQHGFVSDPCTWDRMEGWILPMYRFSTRVTVQTTSMKPYDDQALELRTRMGQSGGNDWVLIGHSNGGIVSRRAAQVEANAYAGMAIRGVLTIGSPHGGAPAMNNALPLVRGFFQAVAYPFKNSLCSIGERGCNNMRAATEGIVQKIYELQRDHLGAALQMTTTSPFREQLESRPEPFIRASIVSHAYPKWQWVRMWADMKCAQPESACGGKEAVKRIQRLEKHLKKVTVLHSLGMIGSSIAGQPVAASYFGKQVLSKGGHLAVLHATEWAYNKWIRGGEDSDGIVPGWSQVYPRTAAAQQFHIPDADSHTGSTKSLKVRIRVDQALQATDLFNVLRQ